VLIDCLSDPDKRIALKAAELLLDRGWGKAAQTLAGEDGEGPAELVVRWATQSKS
jgi:hypothetical protein